MDFVQDADYVNAFEPQWRLKNLMDMELFYNPSSNLQDAFRQKYSEASGGKRVFIQEILRAAIAALQVAEGQYVRHDFISRYNSAAAPHLNGLFCTGGCTNRKPPVNFVPLGFEDDTRLTDDVREESLIVDANGDPLPVFKGVFYRFREGHPP